MLETNREIPQSLKECYAMDHVSGHLWNWSEWLKKWGYIAFWILIVIGAIATIIDVVQVAEIDSDMIFVTGVSSMISWAWYAFIEYCAYNVLALLIAALASIVQNTKITAKVSLYTAAKEEGALVQKETVAEEEHKPLKTRQDFKQYPKVEPTHSWRCNQCGMMRSQSPCPHCGAE